MPRYGNNSKRNQRLLRRAEIGENDHLSRANFRRPNDDLCAMNCICGSNANPIFCISAKFF
jgi:hypothetical protein